MIQPHQLRDLVPNHYEPSPCRSVSGAPSVCEVIFDQNWTPLAIDPTMMMLGNRAQDSVQLEQVGSIAQHPEDSTIRTGDDMQVVD